MDRLRQLLSLLSEKGYITYAQISEQLGVSSRTIYSDVSKLNNILSKNGATIITKAHYGLRLEIEDSMLYEDFIINWKRDEPYGNDSIENRLQEIIEILITQNDYIKMDDLCEELYVSRSTLKNDLKKVRTMMAPFHLDIIFKSYEGIKVMGNEQNLRRCLAKIRRDKNQADICKTSDELEVIEKILKDIFRKHEYKVSEFAFRNLAIHLYIAISRIQMGSIMSDETIKIDQIDELDYIIAEDIVTQLEELYTLVFPKNELLYIVIHLESKKMLVNENNTVINSEIYEIVTSMLKEIKDTFQIDFRHDFELITLLSLHLTPLRIRLMYDMTFENPLMIQIRESFPLAYEMANVASKALYSTYGTKLTADEIAYIALHFNVAIERKKKRMKKNVMIVCGTGRGSAELLAYQVKEKYGNYINVVKTHESVDLTTVNFKDIDYILTTVHIHEKVPVPIIEIKNFLDNQQEGVLDSYLNLENKNKISMYFSPDLFISNIELDDKDEILKVLCDKANQYKHTDDKFYELVMEREKIGSTSFGNYIAIPHPYKLVGEESFVVVGILKNPVSWDDEKVQIVFLLSMKKGGDENLHLFYKTASKLLMDKKLIHQLIQNQSYKELISIMKDIT